ncbi:hypothetical protein M0657_001398 [Pyricularia oryzae]|nr:hypothetical protein M9X92_005686 [Pyricularia oryzae]KAI7931036.1 hypothetical protein M0657_001398 [Pyricularia oryzae]
MSPVSDEKFADDHFANKGPSSTHRLKAPRMVDGAKTGRWAVAVVANWLASLRPSAPRHFSHRYLAASS